MVAPDSNNNVNIVFVGSLVEGGVLCFGLLLGWFGCFDHQQPLSSIGPSVWPYAIGWGLVATIPMFGYLILFHFWSPVFYRPMQRFIDNSLRPMLLSSTYPELLILSVMAGFGEELFFRWCLQGGITSLIEPWVGTSAAIGIGLVLASLIFGACHWVNKTYAVAAAIIGSYLGATMLLSGTWLVPAIAHSLFDFVALVYIVRYRTNTRSYPG